MSIHSKDAVSNDVIECFPGFHSSSSVCSWMEDETTNFPWNVSINEGRDIVDQYVRMKRSLRNIPPPPVHIQETPTWYYPEYARFKLRYESFKDWPKYLKGPSKIDLARSGFVYTRIGDKVTCFSCGMTLTNWESMDDAYKEHLRESENCTFIRMVFDVNITD